MMTQDQKVLQERSPFPLNLPGYLPQGYSFKSGQIPSVPKYDKDNLNVNMTFGGNGKSSLVLTESKGKIVLAESASGLRLGDTQAMIRQATTADGMSVTTIVFEAKGLYHMIMAQEMSKAEVVKVAESLTK